MDEICRVHGLLGSSIVDSSIISIIVSGDLNAATVMIAEKVVDIIKEVEPLPASNAAVYCAEGNYTQ